MIYLIIGIAGLLVAVALATWLASRGKRESEPPMVAPPAECCGAHAVCEKGLKRVDEKIEYFDDEELDALRGIASDGYTDEQIDQFREVFYTIRPEELGDWLVSLEKRGVAFPDILKQEL